MSAELSRAGGSLDGFAEPRPSSPATGPATRLIGGRYRVIGLAGRGGLSEVLIAHDERLDREVALKRLNRPAQHRRLLAEARVAAALEHPAIVPVYDVGDDEIDPYYVMRVVRGRSLGSAIRETPALPARLTLLRALLVAAQAVAFAHSRGVLHGDIKPDNIMLGALGQTQVVDWGLARALGEGSPDFSGTPRYASPEQSRNEPLTAAAEVWSLGATLYELLAGAPPHAQLPAHEVIAATRAGHVPDLALLGAAPPELVAIARRALAPDPTQRYPSVAELADDLARWLDGRLVAAFTYTTRDHLRRLWRQARVPILIALAALVVVIVLVAIGVDRIVHERDQTTASLAEARLAQALLLADQNAGPAASALARASLASLPSPRARGILAAFSLAPGATSVASAPLAGCQRLRAAIAGPDFACLRPDALELYRHDGRALHRLWAVAPVRDALPIGASGPVAIRDDDDRLVLLERETGARTELGELVVVSRNLLTAPAGDGVLVWEHYYTALIEPASPSASLGLSILCRRLDNPIVALAVSRDHQTFAALCEDGAIETLDRASGARKTLATALPGAHRDGIALAVLDRERLVLADTRGSLFVLDADSGALIARDDAGPPGIRALQLPPVADAFETVLVQADDGALRLWRARTGEWYEPLPRPSSTACTHAEHGFLASPTADGPLRLWSYDGCALTLWDLTPGMASIQQPRGISTMTVAPDGRLVAVGDADGISVRDAATGLTRFTIDGHGRMIKDLAFSPDGATLAAVTAGRTALVLVDVARGEVRREVATTNPNRHVHWVDDATLVIGGYGNELLLVDRDDRSPLAIVPLDSTIVDLAPARPPAALVFIDQRGRLFQLTAPLADPRSLTRVNAIARASRILTTASGLTLVARDNDVLARDDLRADPRPILHRDRKVTALAAHGDHVAVADASGGLGVYALPDMAPRWFFAAHRERIPALAFTPEGHLLSASWDRRIRRFGALTGPL